MRNILFLTYNGVIDSPFGGPKGSIRNFRSIKKYFNVFPYQIKKKSSFKSAISLIEKHFPPLLDSDLDSIKEFIKKNNISCVFYDSSLFGEVQRTIKLPNIVFCHNCEKDYVNVRFGSGYGLKKSVYKNLVERSELLAINEANYLCTFTERDSNTINRYYNKKANYIIPLSIQDYFNESNLENYKNTNTCLLFGPLGEANLKAFKWFIKNVSPYINCKTIVAGKGMEILKPYESDKVKIIGYVDSLDDLYASVDCVAIPLFLGGGMKVKTAEALMYGKYIFGTDEAFIGYNTLYKNKNAATLCENADTFIRNINAFMDKTHSSFNKYSRKEYLDNYSIEATQYLFDDLMHDFLNNID